MPSSGGLRRPGFATQRSFFSYGVAASYIGKGRPYDPSKHVFNFSPHCHQQQQQQQQLQQDGRPGSRPESGQDAFFVSNVGDSGAVALGIADGVGGWMDSGVDPADFSHGLCEYMATAANTLRWPSLAAGKAEEPIPARQLIQLGYDAVCRDRSIPAGGSTAVVGVLTPAGLLEVANLGDSGFIHLRLNAVHAVSDPQTHAFNTPFQLSVIPPSLLARMAAFGGAQLSDEPRDAEVSRHDLQHGDVLVFASDGVWDNLFNQDVLHLVSSAMQATGAWYSADDAGLRVAPASDLRRLMYPQSAGAERLSSSKSGGGVVTLQSLIATHITAAAKAASINDKRDGPFSKEVRRYYPQESWHGGKVDDICVVVAIVSEDTATVNGQPAPELPLKSRL
ncbi:5-azacytidine resistance protein azr1 [Grosmannia clavigera kw1407]|uniref:Protein phosphatase n=1 Tax=Grosmannia clavigera (strain kw1407 / UAMH 11150) TaxID=655863 RepID=F0XF18_GROCL|nr:5-azacytidine resistance protein azr1 [Grosmannia clavigera kw1407]EFX03851.1 5-azacytidine resistance protein azr1 [Grosmannia clavigera kw1407]